MNRFSFGAVKERSIIPAADGTDAAEKFQCLVVVATSMIYVNTGKRKLYALGNPVALADFIILGERQPRGLVGWFLGAFDLFEFWVGEFGP